MSGPVVASAKLTNVVLQSADLLAAADFYGRLFGFEPFHRDATCCFLRTGSAHLVFILVDPPSQRVCLDLSVPDLAVAATALEAEGIEFDASEPNLLKLRDPDGNLVELVCG